MDARHTTDSVSERRPWTVFAIQRQLWGDVDHQRSVVRFNKINIALLAGAQTRDQYLRLRNAASHADWLQLSKISSLHSEHVKALEHVDNFEFWKQKLANKTENSSSQYKSDFDVINDPALFGSANYTTQDKAFAKVHALASSLKMDAVLLDLTNREGVIRLARDIHSLGLRLALLNISNAASSFYALGNGTAIGNLIEAFQSIAESDSVLLVSKEYVVPHWLYAGFTFEYLTKTHGDLAKMIASHFNKIISVIDTKSVERESATGVDRYDEKALGQDIQPVQSQFFFAWQFFREGSNFNFEGV